MFYKNYTRRQILKGASALFVFPFFACESRNKKKPQKNIISEPVEQNLKTSEVNIRNSLKYVDKSPVEGRTCDNCKLYTNPTGKNGIYGGCKILPGPIHPKGYCISWIHRM